MCVMHVMHALHMVCRLSGASWTLRRRYRDWERLHDTLASSGELFYLHSLPPKHVKREVSLLRERASALGAYCNELLRRADALSALPVTEFFEIDEGMWRKACAGGSRKVQQQAAGAEIARCERQWSDTVLKCAEIEAACRAMEAQLGEA